MSRSFASCDSSPLAGKRCSSTSSSFISCYIYIHISTRPLCSRSAPGVYKNTFAGKLFECLCCLFVWRRLVCRCFKNYKSERGIKVTYGRPHCSPPAPQRPDVQPASKQYHVSADEGQIKRENIFCLQLPAMFTSHSGSILLNRQPDDC